MNKILFLSLALFVVPVSAQKNDVITKGIKTGVIISGRVLDSSTNEPLGPKALIVETVDNDTAAYCYTFTDKEGSFSFLLYGEGHVLKISYPGYMIVKIPIDKTNFEIKLEKASSDYIKDRVLYELLDNYRSTDSIGVGQGANINRVPNIRVVKPEEVIDDGEGVMIMY